ncbi:MAG: hypothetical protein PUB32_02665 [Clostridiales bacterium]|nr:hypothetical protein [Clostridiales bacterium]
MAYGKLVNGRLIPAPDPLKVRNGEVCNPSGYLYEAVGYRLIVDTPMPESMAGSEENCRGFRWEEWDGQIVKVWLTDEPAESAQREREDCGGKAQAAANRLRSFFKR